MREREVVVYECLDRVKLENGRHSPLFERTEEGACHVSSIIGVKN